MRRLIGSLGIALAVSCAGRSLDKSSDSGNDDGNGGSIGSSPMGKGGGTAAGGRSPMAGRGGSAGTSGTGSSVGGGVQRGGAGGTTGTGGDAGGSGDAGGGGYGAWGGDAGGGGIAGDGGGIDECVWPPVTIELEPWIDGRLDDLDEELDRVTNGMFGSWYGVVTTPWTPPYEVTARFGEDGSYSAQCDANECCVAFYFGTDDDTNIKVYELTTIGPEGVFGLIDIAFEYGPGVYDLPGWQGELHRVNLDATGNRLRFDFIETTHGPVSFDLARTPEL